MFEIGRYYEDFQKGMTIRHALSKTIYESDNNFFSLLTMNAHPVHTNSDYASAEQHGRILVVGTLVFSLAVGITVPDISGKAIANLGYDEVRHLAPVFINDTIYVESEILSTRSSASKTDRGIIEVLSRVFNQEQVPVLSFKRTVLVKKRSSHE